MMFFDSYKQTANPPNPTQVSSALHPTVIPSQCAPSNPPQPNLLMSSTSHKDCFGKDHQKLWLVLSYTQCLERKLREKCYCDSPLGLSTTHKNKFAKHKEINYFYFPVK